MVQRADRMIEALRSGHEALVGLVRGFAPTGLALRSGASEWDVSQVMSHLGSGAEIGLARLEGALDGSGGSDPDFNRRVWARWDAMSRAERAEGCVGADEALVRRYEQLSASTRESLRVDVGFLPEPLDVATLAGLRLNEVTLHCWDIAVAVDPEARLNPTAVELLLDQAGLFIARTSRSDALQGRRAVIAVHLTHPARALGLTVGEEIRLIGEPADPDGVLSAPAEWWLRLLAGRHDPAHTPASVQLTQTTVTLEDLRRIFPGY